MVFGFINDKRKRIVRKMILASLKKMKPKMVLDNGCGKKGSWDYQKTPEIIIKSADKIYGDDATKLLYKPNSFDCVVFAGVIQYLENPIKSLQECHRILKKDGHLIIATINSNSLINSIGGFKAEVVTFTYNGLRSMLEDQRFKVISEEMLDFPFIPRRRKMVIFALCQKLK